MREVLPKLQSLGEQFVAKFHSNFLEQDVVAFKRKQLLLESEINQFKDNSIEESEAGLQKLNSLLKSLQEQIQTEKIIMRSKNNLQGPDIMGRVKCSFHFELAYFKRRKWISSKKLTKS
jgi:hypothetical protein